MPLRLFIEDRQFQILEYELHLLKKVVEELKTNPKIPRDLKIYLERQVFAEISDFQQFFDNIVRARNSLAKKYAAHPGYRKAIDGDSLDQLIRLKKQLELLVKIYKRFKHWIEIRNLKSILKQPLLELISDTKAAIATLDKIRLRQ